MQSEQPQTPGVSLRRSACDRCRGQKLRCLREGAQTSGRCDRCEKADAECITSPIYRMRNYSIKDGSHSVPLKRRQPDHSNIQRQPERPGLLTPSSTPVDWPSETAFSRHTYGGTPTSFNPPSYSSGLDSLETRLLGSASVSDPVDPWNNGYLTLENLLSGENNIEKPPFTSVDNSAAKIPTPSSSTLGIPSQENSWLPYRGELHETPSSEDLISSEPDVQTKDALDGTYSCTGQLSKINLKLVSLLKNVARGPPYVTFKSLIDAVCGSAGSPSEPTPLEDILNSTRHYLDALDRIANLPRSSPSADSNTSRNPEGYTSTSESTPVAQDDSILSSDSSTTASKQLSDMLMPDTHLDSSVLLLLLTCYIHTLRLHVALFWHIKQYIQAISETGHRTIHPLPGLYGFSNFPLQSGNLQGMMIIQLVTNMFERMETLLGLPREFRIGTRSRRNLFYRLVTSTIADLYFVHQRGVRLAAWGLCLSIGVGGGTIISGYIISNLGWNWTYGICAVIYGVWIVVLFFFCPETAYRRPGALNVDLGMRDKTAELMDNNDKPSTTNIEDVEISADTSGIVESKHSYWHELKIFHGRVSNDHFWKVLTRPLMMLIFPQVLFSFFVYGLTSSWLIVVGSVLAQIFTAPPYNFSVSGVGLVAMSPLIGSIIGAFISGPAADMVIKTMSRRNNGVYEPEFRLVIIIVCLILGGMSFFGFGMSLEAQDPWIGPVIFYGLQYFSVGFMSIAVYGYLTDCHRDKAPEAFAAINLRNIYSFGMAVGIVGAGLTGLLAAHGLKKNGFEVTIFDSESSLDARGRDWTILLHWAMPLFEKLLPEEVINDLPKAICNPYLNFTPEVECLPCYNGITGELLFKSPLPGSRRVSRKRLREVLSQGLDIRWGMKLDEIKFPPDDKELDGDPGNSKVQLVFIDGHTEYVDYVLGTDGASSRVRQLLLGEELAQTQLSGFIFATGITEYHDTTKVQAVVNAHPVAAITLGMDTVAGCGVMYVEDKDDMRTWTTFWTKIWRDSMANLPRRGDTVAYIKETTKGLCEPFQTLVDSTPPDSQCYIDEMKYWVPVPFDNHAGRVTLAGDAAHPMLIFRGQGFQHAITDASNYVDALLKLRSSERKTGIERSETMTAYDTEMIERTAKAVKQSLQEAELSMNLETVSKMLMAREGHGRSA
ncbi:Transient receptor potential cation channel subfamily M member 4 [Talaromyces islandicus]|uniref:Transient receptor potential cation channel subfamily M member 4 n=1 Tax=Talaromyces islandicus TaxID=28573 RepID=A0A0U1M9R5_TALIS|nr:Transient receptor potential cation channel subfamily M member 4 [Talaromyces islandicus]